MTEKINLDHITVVLNQPRFPENIGAAARAVRNMGIQKLRVADPYNYDPERVQRMATRAALDVVENLERYGTLDGAVADINIVVGTTARLGGQRQVLTPWTLADKLIPVSRENKIALVFGREDRGLSNDDLRLCHYLVNIPTAEFSSLNLAQAVMVLCYELFKAGSDAPKSFTPKLANRFELDGMYDDLKDVLVNISYINTEYPDYWMNHIRNFFTRIGLRAREVSIIRGLIRQVNWYGRKKFQDGLDAAEGSDQ